MSRYCSFVVSGDALILKVHLSLNTKSMHVVDVLSSTYNYFLHLLRNKHLYDNVQYTVSGHFPARFKGQSHVTG